MPAGLWHRAVRGPWHRRTRTRDEGFTLVEVLVSITLMTIAMTGFTTFFVATDAVSNAQSGRQTAMQLAQDAIERARQLDGADIVTGRQRCDTTHLCATPATGVSTYLPAGDAQEWDYVASGVTPALPLSNTPAKINGYAFTQHWYVQECWQPTTGGACLSTSSGVLFYRVVVAVTWADKNCKANSCSFVTPTLISSAATSPLFNSNQQAQPPTVTDPGAQVGEVGVAVNLNLIAGGGAPPIVWTQTGLPAGLSLDPVTGAITGTPTTAGAPSVTVTATDGFGLSDSSTFTWTIYSALTLPAIPARYADKGIAITPYLVSASGGVTPYTWTVTGLPSGLTFNSGTTQVTGTPTAAGTFNPSVKVVDGLGATITRTFTWTVAATGPTITAPTGTRTDTAGNAVNLTATATGGSPSYTWSWQNAPTGLSLNSSTGAITGTLGPGTHFFTTITVTDGAGVSNSVVLDWTVNGNGVLVQIDKPNGFQINNVNTSLTLTSQASKGTGTIVWAATGIPTGVTLSSSTGKFTGTPTVKGVYTVRLTATDNNGAGNTAVYMFTWTIQ